MNYMKLAEQVADMSGCKKLQVGSVIVKGIEVLAVGFNKAMSECKSLAQCQVGGSCKNTIHAEILALMECAKQGFSVKGADVYITHYPCTDCMNAIKESGIKRVFYKHYYAHKFKNNFHEGMELIKWEGTE